MILESDRGEYPLEGIARTVWEVGKNKQGRGSRIMRAEKNGRC